MDILRDREIDAGDLRCAEAMLGEFGGDNRAGIEGTLHRISALRNRKVRPAASSALQWDVMLSACLEGVPLSAPLPALARPSMMQQAALTRICVRLERGTLGSAAIGTSVAGGALGAS